MEWWPHALAMIAVTFGIITVIRYRGWAEEMSEDTALAVRTLQGLEEQIAEEERLKLEGTEKVLQAEEEMKRVKQRLSEVQEQIQQAGKRQEELELDLYNATKGKTR